MMMPYKDGQEVLTELRQHPETASIPFIFLTAVDGRDTVRASMNLGADDYLFKPFSVKELVKTVNARLKHHQEVVATAEQQLEAIKMRLARTITHELRTPVGLIVGALQVLSWQENEPFSDETRDMITTMAAGATRLAHVVEQMVYATNLTTGVYSDTSFAKNGMPFEVSELIAASHKLARQFTSRQPLNVEVKVIEQKNSIYVRAEPGALKQAIAEVISNAIAFSPPDGTIRVTYKQLDNEVRITITDSGQGIDDEHLKEAMTWFGQVNRDVQEQQGLGMGLPLAEQLIAVHGGTLEIHSIVGRGTQAVITLPAADLPA